jgi:threonine dehydrogenase-like Zn-dependent dehydrogenase
MRAIVRATGRTMDDRVIVIVVGAGPVGLTRVESHRARL